MSPEASVPASEPSKDRDLYCLQCGYNLRGLSGDPRRCPECFHLNPVEVMMVPAEVIAKQLRSMETAPCLCLASGLFVACLSVLLISFFYRNGMSDLDGVACMAVALAIAFVACAVSTARFRKDCNARRGWASALRSYLMYGLCVIVLLPVVAASGAVAIFELFPSARGRTIAGLFYILAASPAYHYFSKRAYRAALRGIEPLQRETAVAIAREQLRMKMITPNRTWHWDDL